MSFRPKSASLPCGNGCKKCNNIPKRYGLKIPRKTPDKYSQPRQRHPGYEYDEFGNLIQPKK